MTRKSKKCRPPGPNAPERPGETAYCLPPGFATQARMPYSLLAVCGLLLLAVALVFTQTARHGFIIYYDDQDYVCDNPQVADGLTASGTAWAITHFHSDNWHPLTWLSHMLDCQLYGLQPGGHHLSNVLLHAAASVVLFLAMWRMTLAPWPSAWVAAVFAIHPLRVESVAWVAERKDVLSGLFFMLTLWFYARYAERPASFGRYLLVLASFALGLTAKPMLVTLPFVLLLLDYWPLGRLAWSAPRTQLVRLVVEKIPLFVLAAASCLVTLAAQRAAMRSLGQVAFAARVANAAVAYVAYLGKMLYPAGLAVFYPIAKGPPLAWEVIAAVALLLAISTAVFLVRRKCPYLLFGWLWYLGTLVPVIGLVQVGMQAMADRYTYLTQVGLYMAIAWGGERVFRHWRYHRPVVGLAAALGLMSLALCAWQQTAHWKGDETLWRYTLASTSKNWIAHNNLGAVLTERGQAGEAIAEFQEALNLRPDFELAHYNLAFVLAGSGQVDAAVAHYEEALKLKPDYAQAHNNLGFALAARGQVDEAIGHYREALKINPDYAEAHSNLAFALGGRGQVDEAVGHYEKALEIRPDNARDHNNLGFFFARRGQLDKAVVHYRKALELMPDYALAHNNLGNALVGEGQLDEPIARYEEALKIKPNLAALHYNLADALATRGQVDEAITHYRKALQIKPDYIEAHNNLGIALTERGRLDEAIAHYRQALQIKPD